MTKEQKTKGISTWVTSELYRVPDNTSTGALALSKLETERSFVSITPYENNIFRITVQAEEAEPAMDSLVVNKQPQVGSVQIETSNDEVTLKTDAASVVLNKRTGALAFFNADNQAVLRTAERKPFRLSESLYDEGTYQITNRFTLGDEAIYGLGQFYNDTTSNWRGHSRILIQGNQHVVNPTVVSTSGWGLFWDNYSKTIFRDGHDGMSFTSEVADRIDYYVFVGENMSEVIDAYRELTGKAPMFPRWAFGYFQSKQRYQNDSEILDHARKFRESKIPIDVIVQDWQYWGEEHSQWSSMEFHPDKYSDPKETIRTIHEDLNMKYMISIWPMLGNATEIYSQMDEKGWLSEGDLSWVDGAKLYDAYNPEARKLYWKFVNDGLMKMGVDALWTDGTEPEMQYYDTREPFEDIKDWGPTCLGSRAKYLNPFSLVTNEGIHDGWRKDVDSKRVFILTRSGFAGQQRAGAVTWSGDVYASWEVLESQIAAGLNFSLSGIPYWTFDIGGFFIDDAPKGLFNGFNGDYGELYTRWFQAGAFLPIFRSHGDHRPREPWQFGGPGDVYYDTQIKYLNLRYRLLPYIYSWASRVTLNNDTMLRHLALDFPHDKNTWHVGDQFLLGDQLLVAPITSPGASTDEPVTRSVYLPEGSSWVDFWTGQRYSGGQEIDYKADITTIPLFLRSGAIIPMGPVVQYSTEKLDAPLEIRIVPGADGEFQLYEDDNDGYDYESGNYSQIKFIWDDTNRQLRIEDISGPYRASKEDRQFKIVLVEEGSAADGCDVLDARTVLYNGDSMLLDI